MTDALLFTDPTWRRRTPADYLPMASVVVITRGRVEATLNLVMTLGILMTDA